MVCAPFLGFRNFIHNGIVVLQQPPPLFHVVRFQNLLTGFLNGQFRGISLFLEIHQYRMAFRLLVQKPL